MSQPKYTESVLATACPQCDAQAGDRCVSRSGKTASVPHGVRASAAKAEERAAEARKAEQPKAQAPKQRAKNSHVNCTHPRTHEGRVACRKARKALAALVDAKDWTAARAAVASAAREGRVYVDAGDKHNGGITRVHVNGVEVGQASALLHFPFTTDTGRESGVVIPKENTDAR